MEKDRQSWGFRGQVLPHPSAAASCTSGTPGLGPPWVFILLAEF